MNNATFSNNEIPVRYSYKTDVGLEFLTISVPNGWDDVKKLTKKVLTFEGKKFTFCGWNSDRNECFFNKPINGENQIAKIS